MSIARLTLPSRLELKRPEGSFSDAPLAKVSFTTVLYVSPVQISPLCDHTGTPLHFHSSTTSGSACLIRARSRDSILPRQSSSSSILASMSRAGDSSLFERIFFFMSFFLLHILLLLSLLFMPFPASFRHALQPRSRPRAACLESPNSSPSCAAER